MTSSAAMVSCRCWRAFFFAFLLFFVGVFTFGAEINASDKKSNVGVTVLLDVLEKLLLFFKKNYQNVNLDAVFGLRVIEGQCKLLVEEYERGELEFVSSSLMKRVGQIGVDAGKLGNMAIPHVHESDHKYLVLLKNFVATPWKVFRPHRIVNPSLRWTGQQYSPPDFGEEDSDRCLGELSRTPNRPACRLSEDCLVRMFSSGQTGYHLQHQILYTILAQKVGCEREVNEYLVSRTRFKDLDQVQHEFCTNAYYELEETTIASHRRIQSQYRDLFLEMESFCPSLGYFQFMRNEWLEAIVTWQSDDGCFPKILSAPTLGVPSYGRIQGRESVVGSINLFEQVPVYQQAIQPSLNGDYRLNGVQPVQSYLDNGVTAGSIRAHVPVYHESIQPQKQSQIGLNVPWTNDVAYASRYGGREYARTTHPPVVQYHFAPVADYPRPQVSSDVLQSHYDIPYKMNRGLRSLDYDRGGDHFGSNRRLLREKELSDGCLAHFTSVASSALVMYLRYLIDPGPPEFMHLRMENYLRGTPPFQPRTDSVKPSVVVNELSSIGKLHYDAQTASRPIQAVKTAPNLDDMRTKAYNFMGTYQRQWGPRFRSIQEPDVPRASDRLPDHVHAAEVHKELADWTVVPITTVATSVSSDGLRYRELSTLPNWLRYKSPHSNEASFTDGTLDSVLRANLIDGGHQIDLDHYLIVVVVISIGCLFILYRYYRQRRHSKCKARHL